MLNTYRNFVDQGEIEFSSEQFSVLQRLSNINNFNNSFFSNFRKKKSIYLFGDVGIGKSFIMSIFFNACKKKSSLSLS
ncbi:cell division protein ZapE [Anaplasmataceae bacterium AB001_6]|nr:cell division protein ZapE [Anaplasmataceae bacterium AB001_6]